MKEYKNSIKYSLFLMTKLSRILVVRPIPTGNFWVVVVESTYWRTATNFACAAALKVFTNHGGSAWLHIRTPGDYNFHILLTPQGLPYHT